MHELSRITLSDKELNAKYAIEMAKIILIILLILSPLFYITYYLKDVIDQDYRTLIKIPSGYFWGIGIVAAVATYSITQIVLTLMKSRSLVLPPKPLEDDFDDYDDYLNALIEWMCLKSRIND